MKSFLAALVSGLIFGLGLTISQMINPQKVLGFLDFTGNWDPSLALVMGAALATTFIGYRYVLRAPEPLFADRFRMPDAADIDARLLAGAVTFGIGWGLVGLCPGPAIAILTLGGREGLVFAAAMVAGIVLFRVFRGPRQHSDHEALEGS
jgi:hypothetical protein